MDAKIEDLDEEKRKILKEFRELVQDILRPNDDDYFLLRWLRARDYHTGKAEIMLRQHYKFLKKAGVENILKDYEIPQVFKRFNYTAFLGFDNEGSLVRLYSAGSIDFKGMIKSLSFGDVIKYFTYVLESDVAELEKQNKKTGRRVDKSTYISDFEGFSLKQVSDREVIRCAIQWAIMYQDNFPERLKVFFFINVPTVFYWIFNRIKPFMDPVVLSKFRFYGKDGWKEDILKLVPAEILPACYGGTRYEPKGDPKCSEIICWDRMIPSHYFMKNSLSSQGDPNMKKIVIPKRSSYDIEMRVDKPGSTLSWEFITKDYNVRFGVFFKSKPESIAAKDESPEELIEVQNVDCHIYPEKGELICEKTGKYILHFDNTYSWLTPKHLSYTSKITNTEVDHIVELQ